MKTFRKIFAFALILLCWAHVSWADKTTGKADFIRNGADFKTLSPISFSPDGKTLIAWDRASYEEKKQGIMFRLWVLKLERDGFISGMKKIPLELPNLESGTFTPDGKSYIILGDNGTQFLKLDIKSSRLDTIHRSVANQPGFKATARSLWTNDGKVLVEGYFYTPERYTGPDVIASIDPNKTGASAFKAETQMFSFLRQNVSKIKGYSTNKTDLVYVIFRDGNLNTVNRWTPGAERELSRIDDGITSLKSMWGSDEVMVYSATYADNTAKLVVFDNAENKRTVIADATIEDPYRYVFASGNGEKIVACKLNVDSGNMRLFYAKKSEGWELKPLTNRPYAIGTIRIDKEGNKVCIFSSKSVDIINIP